MQLLERGFGVFDEHRFRDFQFQPVSRQACGFQHRLHQRYEFGIGQLHGRDIHGHAHAFELVLPAFARMAQCPQANQIHHAFLLSHWDELARAHLAELGAFPTQQGFGSGDFPGGEIHLGLPMQAEFVAADSLAQAFFHLGPPAGAFSQCVGVFGSAPPAMGLGVIQRNVGPHQQFVHMGDFTVYQRNAYAGAHSQSPLFDLVGA